MSEEKGLTDVVGNVVTAVPKAGIGLVSGVAHSLPLPEILPDAEKIDNLADVATISAYSLITFSVTGTLFFTFKTVREFGQWRQWYRFTKSLKNKKKL